MSRRVVIGAIAAVLIAVSFALSCGGKSSSPTAPAGGGGGGAPELSSGNIGGGGGVFAHTFNTAGTFNYHCTIHGLAMSGAVTVMASGAPTSASMNVVNDAYQNPGNGNASSATIMVGGTVTWTNNSGTTHTVTSN